MSIEEYWNKFKEENNIDTNELKDTPLVFSEDILVVTEEFEICTCQNL